MADLTQILIFLALTIGLIAFVLAMKLLADTKKLKTSLERQRQESHLLMHALRNEAHAMGSGSIGVGQRLVEVEKRLFKMAERQEDAEQSDSGATPYAYAVRLVEMGATAEDLVNNCGLAKVEADLLVLIHGELKEATKAPKGERYSS